MLAVLQLNDLRDPPCYLRDCYELRAVLERLLGYRLLVALLRLLIGRKKSGPDQETHHAGTE